MTVNLFSLAADRMTYLGQAQSLLAQNIANIDTPDFSPKVAVPFADVLNGSGRLPLAITNPADIRPAGDRSITSEDAAVAARAPDGNAVSLHQQLAAVARNQIDQQYAVNMYKTYLGMFTTALGPNP